MRVLMLAWEYPPHIVGGMGKHIAELVPVLDAAGIEVHVLTPWLRGGQQHERFGMHSHIWRVQPPAMPDYGFVSFTQETNRYLERFAYDLGKTHGPFDLIHGHDWLTSYCSVALKYAWHTPLITTIHATERGRGRGSLGGDHAKTINGLEWWLAHESWRVIVCSDFMADQLHQFFGTPFDKLDVIANGVNVPTIEWPSQERQQFRQKYAAENEKIVFSIARMVYEKGIQVLVEAIPHVLAQRRDVKFVIAGMGPLAEQLRNRSHELGINDHVYWTGFVTDQDRNYLYNVADVAAFPSIYEPFGIVALEAMAAHCPVIVSDTGGLHEVVQNHETGLTIYPDNPESLAWGILHTLEHPKWTKQRVAHAFKTVVDIYNWPLIASQTQAVYQRVCDERAVSMWG
ncbi:glycosyltransferase family 4 protein [Herpetosiphon sp. NSE202]|uniref:glycosyltransferase family 4 protein n=1 Tax=Herpetosiphon sp. NSE202 TaxID=3351349 RepID=UPI003627B4F0